MLINIKVDKAVGGNEREMKLRSEMEAMDSELQGNGWVGGGGAVNFVLSLAYLRSWV